MDAETKIARAKTRLVLDHPFWGSLVLGTAFHKDDIPTMCTNGQWIKWSADFVDKCSDKNVIFTVAHEISHIFLKHCDPIKEIDGKPVNAEVQNMAMDYVINPILIDGNVGEMPEGGLYDPKYHGWSWLKVYRELMQMDESERPQPQPWGGNVGSPEDDNGNEMQGSELEQFNATIDQRVFLAATGAQSTGKLPSAIAELVERMRRSKVDWRDVFNRFIGGDQPDDYTFRKPNKKVWYTQGIYTPSIDKIGVGDVVVAVDTSGSVSTAELQQFLGELNNITDDHKPRSVTVITCDADIKSVVRYEQGDIIDTIECNGRGGTRVEPVFRYIRENDLPVDNMVYLTDMGIWDFPDNTPDYPVLWVSTDPQCNDAPFGETTRIQVAA
tara:strand:- start:3253 stop:4404 length:1152 start_codon:yes stop_codon:yes gene_type:complete